MITITPDALSRLSAFLTESKTVKHVRVFLASASCGGDGQLSLTVDDPTEADFSSTIGDIVFSIGKDLQELTGEVKIDFKEDGRDSGFVVESAKILPVMDSGCGGCCGCD
jgi:Fe-S cluster assembly iron-binding protein IscA